MSTPKPKPFDITVQLQREVRFSMHLALVDVHSTPHGVVFTHEDCGYENRITLSDDELPALIEGLSAYLKAKRGEE